MIYPPPSSCTDATDPKPVETLPAPIPVPPIPPPSVTVTVTGVKLGLMSWAGSDGGNDVTYLVPTYRFATRDESGNVSEVEVLALTDDALTPETTAPVDRARAGDPAADHRAHDRNNGCSAGRDPNHRNRDRRRRAHRGSAGRRVGPSTSTLVEYTVDDVSVGSSPLDTGARHQHQGDAGRTRAHRHGDADGRETGVGENRFRHQRRRPRVDDVHVRRRTGEAHVHAR